MPGSKEPPGQLGTAASTVLQGCPAHGSTCDRPGSACQTERSSPDVAVAGRTRMTSHEEMRPAFAPIAGGWFTMGTALGQDDERPPHRVFVDPFELGIYP